MTRRKGKEKAPDSSGADHDVRIEELIADLQHGEMLGVFTELHDLETTVVAPGLTLLDVMELRDEALLHRFESAAEGGIDLTSLMGVWEDCAHDVDALRHACEIFVNYAIFGRLPPMYCIYIAGMVLNRLAFDYRRAKELWPKARGERGPSKNRDAIRRRHAKALLAAEAAKLKGPSGLRGDDLEHRAAAAANVSPSTLARAKRLRRGLPRK